MVTAGTSRFDVVVVGAGIAGASMAYFLTQRGVTSILILEREAQPGYHATGRSAATLAELDPIPVVMRLKVLGGQFLRDPPAGFAEAPLLERSGILVLLRGSLAELVSEALPSLEAMGIRLVMLSRAEAIERVPVLSGPFDGAVLLPEDGHMDVHGLLSSYLRHARANGAVQRLRAEVLGVRVEGGRCTGVLTNVGEFRGRWIVNAAGAWAGALGARAGATPLALVPYRRTIVTFAAPGGVNVQEWPLVQSEADQLYFGPESGGLLASPMDEEPMGPCDAQPGDLAVAETMDRLATVAPRLVPRAIRRAWAGLRTFAPDRIPVVGEDPNLPGFFWLAGQGGYGIETSPAVSQIAADLLVTGRTDRFDAALLAPSRFGSG